MGQRKISDYLNSGEIESIVFNKDTPTPPHVEGMLSYDSESHTHTSDNDIDDTTLNIGDEQRIRIINLSGVDIENGKPLRQTGVDATTGLPTVDLAQANTISNANVLCFSTHAITNGSQGVGVTEGLVNKVNTTSVSSGTIYLSDSTPGEYTNTPPVIITMLGFVMASDEDDGIILVSISNTISFPTFFALLRIINDPYDLTTSYQDLINYQSDEKITLITDVLAGTISGFQGGFYRCTFNITITVPTSTSTRSFTVNIRDITSATDLITYIVPIPRDTTQVSRSFSVPFEIATNDSIIAQIKSDVVISGVTINSISFDVQSISLTL